jgi:succinyldiaminopimelate transaminase
MTPPPHRNTLTGIQPLPRKAHPVPRTNPLLETLEAYPLATLVRAVRDLRAAGGPVHNFGLGDPDEPTPDFIRQALREAVPEVSQYPTVRGTIEVRAAIAAYLERRFGVTVDPDTQVLPTSGSKEAVFHLPLAVIDPAAPDRTVIFPDPSYPAYGRGTLFAGGEPHAVGLASDWRFRPWELPGDLLDRARILYINSPHNPSGATMGLEELRRTWALCQEHDVLLVADECYADMYDEHPPPSLLEVASEGALVIHSLSKRSGMTGYRSGFLAGDPHWISTLGELRTNPGVAPQDFVNAAAAAAWSDDEHAAERRACFAAKRALMRDFLEGIGLQVAPSQSTFYLWFRAPEGHDDVSYAALLRSAGIVVVPGRMLGHTRAAEGWLRLALVPDLEGCQAACEDWPRIA